MSYQQISAALQALAISIGLSATQLLAQAVAPTPATPVAETTLDTLNDDANRMTVPVMINGQGPFQFIVDTGATRSVVSQELAAKLALTPDKSVRLNSMSGTDRVQTVKLARVQVSNKIVDNIIAPALPQRFLGADGVLGLDCLGDTRVVLDFRAQTMTVAQSSKEAEPADEPGTIVVSAKSRFGQLILVDADTQGEKIFVVLDTGAQNTVGNARLRALLEKLRVKPVQPIQMVSVTGGIVMADYTQISAMRVGGVRITNAPMAFAEVHPFTLFGLTRKPSMLLGMDVLRHFDRVSIDFANRKIRFLLPRAGNVPANRFAFVPAVAQTLQR